MNEVIGCLSPPLQTFVITLIIQWLVVVDEVKFVGLVWIHAPQPLELNQSNKLL